MKGHVGGGSGHRQPLGAGWSVKAKSFHVSLHIHSICEVQERLPEMPALDVRVRPGAEIGHKLESLILAQNERWRHA